MRKWMYITALLTAMTCALCACGEKNASTQNTQTIADQENGQTDDQKDIQDNDLSNDETDGQDDSQTGNQENEASAEHKVTAQIKGYDADHIPRMDGSLANEPLIHRLMCDLTGCDSDTADIYLSDCFINGGTSTSWGRLAYEEKDLIISYEAPDEVKESYKEEMEDMEIDALGRDGLVFIVNANNPIESLTLDQIRDIYTGKIKDWSEVGGEAGKIHAYQRNSTSGSQTLFDHLLMKDTKPMKPKKEYLIDTMGGLIEKVASFDGSGGAIGFSVYYYADNMKADPNLKIIKVDGVAPSNESIADGEYPLVNDFYVAIRKNEKKESPARALRDWLLSDDGKTLLEEEGYVCVE